jgi:tetratricopeptide (TPR) repeat protein
MIVFLNNLLNKNSQNISAGILLSDLLILDKQFDKASVIVASLITNNNRIASLYISQANIKLAQNDKQGALSVYHEGLKNNPDDLKLSLSLAALNKVMGDYAAAIERYESLLVKNPSFDIAINNLAIVLAENFDDEVHLKKAGELAEKLKDSPQPYYKDTYAWVLIKRGEFRQGLNVLNELVTKFPDEPIFRYHLAFAHHKNGQIGSAISELKQSLEIAKRKGAFPEQKNAEKLLEEILAKPKQS